MSGLPPQGLSKPAFRQPCNGCGYCCATQPCQLAQEYLQCTQAPCVALEMREGVGRCGLVRNPLGYLFKATHPQAQVPVLEEAPDSEHGHWLSSQFAAVLGLGMGCDAQDDAQSTLWPGNADFTQPGSGGSQGC